jgi:predicted O-methyltransferase YrrM
MTTKVEQLYGTEHFDNGYFESLKNFLSGREFKRGVEIGLAWGMSAMAYLETQDSKLISIDLNDNMQKSEGLKKVFGDQWEFIVGDSNTTLAGLSGKFDWIYIDGDHSYEIVKQDLVAAHKKLAKGGMIVCDDYGNPCGVKQAVDEFVKSYGFTLTPMSNNPNGGVILTK